MPRPTTTAPLAGISVLIARPVGRGATLARKVRALGGHAVALPTASLRLTDAPELARRMLRTARSAYAAIFTSPAAVRFAYALAPALHFARGTHVFAVGPTTARALRRHGLAVTQPAARYDSEGVLAIPALAALRGRRAVLVTAPGGRDALARTLARRGARVERIDVYRRVLPRWRRGHHEGLRAAPSPRVLLLSSSEGLAALRALLAVSDWRRLQRDRVVASSARVAHAARVAGFARIAVARSALPADLLAAVLRCEV